MEVDRLLLAQLVCDTIQSLCEYLMTYPSLMEEIFLKRTPGVGGGGGVLPTMAYTGRLRPKGIPYLVFRYIKGWGFTAEVYEKVGNSIISVCKKGPKGEQMHFMALKKSKKKVFVL